MRQQKLPFVSIVIPVYNRQETISATLFSVIDQTFKDYELIIVDDCSTDLTDNLIKTAIRNLNGVFYTRLKKNSGSPVVPRNFGCRVAVGEYIAFLDADDFWAENKLDVQATYANITKAPFLYHDMVVMKDRYTQHWSKMATCHSGVCFDLLLKKNFIPTSSVMIRRDIYKKYGPMDIRYRVSHDWDLWLKIAFGNEITFCDARLGILNMREGSVITDNHRRRVECRKIIRGWMNDVDGMWYRKIMLYYYLMEVFDILPEFLKKSIRSKWYKQEKYK